jgi:hypothetical protein
MRPMFTPLAFRSGIQWKVPCFTHDELVIRFWCYITHELQDKVRRSKGMFPLVLVLREDWRYWRHAETWTRY